MVTLNVGTGMLAPEFEVGFDGFERDRLVEGPGENVL
jgi:hypothetical protein